MRLLCLTGGASEMYCGSCLRDNALATALTARGHDVTLLPVYTPTRTDEENVSEDRVFLGGVSVYLQQKVPLLRHTPWLVDRLWDSRAVLRAAARARRSVSTDARDLGELTVSMLKGEDGFQHKEVEKLVHWAREQPAFDLVVLPYSLLLGLAPALKRALGRPVACTLQGEDLFLERMAEPWRTQSLELIRRHAPHVDGFVAVSDYYADFMSRYLGLPRERMHVVPLGVNVEGYEPRRDRAPGPFTIGYMARVAPEKGLHVLCEAYHLMRAQGLPPSRLEVAGYLAPADREYLAEQQRRLESWRLGEEFHYHGTVDRAGKIAFLRSLDVLSVPSPYVEPKGLYLLEAMACGVPVAQPRHGAFPEIVERTGGGVLFEPNDAADLARTVLLLHTERSRLEALGRRAAEGVRRHYTAEHMAERAEQVYAHLAGGQQAPRAVRAGG
jgi:glycosyltransferase involved in cell wall biosynthesis